jgi:hypothetical protein
LLAALAYVGLQVSVVLAIVIPVMAAVIWGVCISPRARYPLSQPLWVAAQVALFGAAVAGLIATDNVVLGIVFGVGVAVNLGLVLFWHQRETDT